MNIPLSVTVTSDNRSSTAKPTKPDTEEKPPPLPSAPPPGVSVSKVSIPPREAPENYSDPDDVYENIDTIREEMDELYENTRSPTSGVIPSEYLYTENQRESIPDEIYDDVDEWQPDTTDEEGSEPEDEDGVSSELSTTTTDTTEESLTKETNKKSYVVAKVMEMEQAADSEVKPV